MQESNFNIMEVVIIQFIIKGKKTADGKFIPLTDGEALALADLMGQKTIVSGKSGVLGTDGSYMDDGGVIVDDKNKPNESEALKGGAVTFVNVDGKKVALHHKSGKKNYARNYDNENSSEFADYIKNKVSPNKAKYLLPVINFLTAIRGLDFKVYENSESVIRDLIQKAYDKVNKTGAPLDVDSINITLNPLTDNVEVIMTPELVSTLKELGIYRDVMSNINDVRARGFF